MPGRFTGHKPVHSGLVSFSHIGFVWHMQVWLSPSRLGLGLWAPIAKAARTNVFSALCSHGLLSFLFPFCLFPLLTLSPLLHPSISSFSSLFLLSFPTTLLISYFSSTQGLAAMGEPADTPGKVLSSSVWILWGMESPIVQRAHTLYFSL